MKDKRTVWPCVAAPDCPIAWLASADVAEERGLDELARSCRRAGEAIKKGDTLTFQLLMLPPAVRARIRDEIAATGRAVTYDNRDRGKTLIGWGCYLRADVFAGGDSPLFGLYDDGTWVRVPSGESMSTIRMIPGAWYVRAGNTVCTYRRAQDIGALFPDA